MKSKLLFITSISIFMLTSCKQAETIKPLITISENEQSQVQIQSQDITPSENTPANSTSNNIIITSTIRNDEVKSDDGAVLINIDYDTPTITIPDNKNASSKINDYLKAKEEEFFKSAYDYKTEANEFYINSGSTTVEDYYYGYSFSGSFSRERIDHSVISLTSEEYYYMGGAHGQTIKSGLNFDAATGELLTLQDISTNKDALIESAKSYILTVCKSPYYQELLFDDYEESIPSILVDGNWYFSKGGLTFIANQYEIAPYVAGIIEFTIPYDQLVGLKDTYKYLGNLELAVGNSVSAKYDLDSDGEIETLSYSISYSSEDEEIPKLTINNQDYSNVFEDNNIYLFYGYCPSYYVVDLDTSDSYIEFAILDNGPNDYSTTHFFRYVNGNVLYLGYVEDLLSNSSCYTDGDSMIHADLHISLLETRCAPALYQLTKKNTIELFPQEWYYPNKCIGTSLFDFHNVLLPVTVYTENDLNSKPVELTSADGPVTFIALDNKHWIQVKTASNDIYYMYMNDFSIINSNGKELNSTDVFENLLVAG
ncbi:MAG: DUF3298 domain-containing protein [Lachnospiraceae bacterium]|nr:DUF3298 domain-containing protein [Lachnospiraceae bacterium]